jgi:hypothetical protein
MSPERAQAYRKVVEMVDADAPSELLDGERDRIRYAADNLIFSRDVATDVAAQEALGDVGRLCRALVDSGRWDKVAARELAEHVSLCGPGSAARLKAA